MGWLRIVILIESACVSFCPPASATRTVNVDVAAGAIGVPEITPVVGFKFSPGGSAPVPGWTMLKVSGAIPPTVWTVWLYAWPILPGGREVVVIESGVTLIEKSWVSV